MAKRPETGEKFATMLQRKTFTVRRDCGGYLKRFRKTLHRGSFLVQEKVLDRVSLV